MKLKKNTFVKFCGDIVFIADMHKDQMFNSSYCLKLDDDDRFYTYGKEYFKKVINTDILAFLNNQLLITLQNQNDERIEQNKKDKINRKLEKIVSKIGLTLDEYKFLKENTK